MTQSIVVRAAFARNIGSLYLIDSSASEHLNYAERWLNYSLTFSEVSSTFRLLGKIQQARGNIRDAMQQWCEAGLVSFSVDTGLQELARADAKEAQIWQQELQAIISEPIEWQKLGAVFEHREEYVQAVDAYQHALVLLSSGEFDQTQASLSEIYYSLAHIYSAQFGDASGAIDAYASAAETDDFLNPWHRMLTHQELASLLISGDSERAVGEARRAVELMPESSMGHSVLGLALYAAYGDLDQAEEEIHIAIDLDPQSVWPWMCLGQLYFTAEEYELSVFAYQRAVELNPEFYEARDMVAFIRRTYLGE